MDAFLQVFGSIPLSTVVIVIVALVFLYTVGKKIYKTIKDFALQREEQKKLLNNISNSIEDIKHEQIILSESIVEMRTIQADFAAKQTEFENGIKKRKMNEIRDNLIRQYHMFGEKSNNPRQAWSALERDSFFALFKDYEELGGDGYMHSVVEPAMNELEVIEMDNLKGIEALASSRLKRASDI